MSYVSYIRIIQNAQVKWATAWIKKRKTGVTSKFRSGIIYVIHHNTLSFYTQIAYGMKLSCYWLKSFVVPIVHLEPIKATPKPSKNMLYFTLISLDSNELLRLHTKLCSSIRRQAMYKLNQCWLFTNYTLMNYTVIQLNWKFKHFKSRKPESCIFKFCRFHPGPW